MARTGSAWGDILQCSGCKLKRFAIATMAKKPFKLFYSYSHKDTKFRDRLESHLSVLKREGLISQWHDRKIGAGSEWKEEIHKALNESDIILLLISSDFLTSDYCFEKEMGRAMELHESGVAKVVPIILRPCDWKNAPFSRLQALPTDGRPVIHWRDHDTAFENIVRGIRDAINNLTISSLEKEIESLKRVLIVDDEESIATSLKVLFDLEGFEAHSALSAEEALDKIKDLKPSVLWTDLLMPGMDGAEFAAEVHRTQPRCKIFLLTAYPDAAARIKSKTLFTGIYIKPFSIGDIIARTQEVVDGLAKNTDVDSSTQAGQ
jgi:CheY-like chemotaxis protein